MELNELPDADLRVRIEGVIRTCIGVLAKNKDWKVWIYSSPDWCQIVIQGPTQTRDRFFFDDTEALAGKIQDWLGAYPLR
jgi:hypothetical protein